MVKEVMMQHKQCTGSPKTSILALASHGKKWDIVGYSLCEQGLAFVKDDHFYLSNPLHLKLVLEESPPYAEWHKLEAYTVAFIQFCQQGASSNSTDIVLPKAEACIQQSKVGQVPINMLSGNAKILKLVDRHPVIDNIFVLSV